jgi:hypothetical protein
MRRRARRTQHNWQVFGLAGTHRFGAPNGRRFPVMMTSADDGGRSCIPLRDSPGFPPGSLSRHASSSCRSMRRAITRRRPVAQFRLPLRIGPVGQGVSQAGDRGLGGEGAGARSADPVNINRARGRPGGVGISIGEAIRGNPIQQLRWRSNRIFDSRRSVRPVTAGATCNPSDWNSGRTARGCACGRCRPAKTRRCASTTHLHHMDETSPRSSTSRCWAPAAADSHAARLTSGVLSAPARPQPLLPSRPSIASHIKDTNQCPLITPFVRYVLAHRRSTRFATYR